jgi:hypothetical protein
MRVLQVNPGWAPHSQEILDLQDHFWP